MTVPLPAVLRKVLNYPLLVFDVQLISDVSSLEIILAQYLQFLRGREHSMHTYFYKYKVNIVQSPIASVPQRDLSYPPPDRVQTTHHALVHCGAC